MTDTPSIPSNALRKSDSGANSVSAQAPNFASSKDVITLKSKHPPHTIRSTDFTPSIAFTFGKYSSNTFCNSTNDFLSSSALHLHRHSRAIVSNSTPSAIVARSEQLRLITPNGPFGANAYIKQQQRNPDFRMKENVRLNVETTKQSDSTYSPDTYRYRRQKEGKVRNDFHDVNVSNEVHSNTVVLCSTLQQRVAPLQLQTLLEQRILYYKYYLVLVVVVESQQKRSDPMTSTTSNL